MNEKERQIARRLIDEKKREKIAADRQDSPQKGKPPKRFLSEAQRKSSKKWQAMKHREQWACEGVVEQPDGTLKCQMCHKVSSKFCAVAYRHEKSCPSHLPSWREEPVV